MHQRFAKAMRVAVRDEGFAQIFGTGVLLVIVGTLTYTTSQDWSLVDGFYFAVATLTTSSIADPDLVITGGPIKIFTVFYILVGIGILVELVRQLGFAYVEVRRERKRRKTPRPTQTARPTRSSEARLGRAGRNGPAWTRTPLPSPSSWLRGRHRDRHRMCAGEDRSFARSRRRRAPLEADQRWRRRRASGPGVVPGPLGFECLPSAGSGYLLSCPRTAPAPYSGSVWTLT
jgi:voltage-gated potassium channel